MKKVLGYFLIALCLFACNSKSGSESQNGVTISHQLIEQEVESIIEFVITNNSGSTVNLPNPYSKSIEFKSGSEWVKFRTLDCPCGASCPPPPNDFNLENENSHSIKWNMKEEWCGPKQLGGRPPEAFSSKAQPGTYRFKMVYKNEASELITLNHEFQIK